VAAIRGSAGPGGTRRGARRPGHGHPVATVLALALVAGQAAAADALGTCGADSQAGMMACLDREAGRARARLERADGALAASIAAWDEEPAYVAAARRAARTARAAHASGRAAQCALREALVGGGAGNARRMAGRACEAELDDARAASLEAIVGARTRR